MSRANLASRAGYTAPIGQRILVRERHRYLTPKQALYVEAVAGGAKPRNAARAAGYRNPGTHAFHVTVYRLRNNPKIARAVEVARRDRHEALARAARAGRRLAPLDALALLNDVDMPPADRSIAALNVLQAEGRAPTADAVSRRSGRGRRRRR